MYVILAYNCNIINLLSQTKTDMSQYIYHTVKIFSHISNFGYSIMTTSTMKLIIYWDTDRGREQIENFRIIYTAS